MDQQVGKDRKFTSIYDDKKQIKNNSSFDKEAMNSKSSVSFMQRKLSSQYSNTSTGFGHASQSNMAKAEKKQGNSLRPLGYNPPKPQMFQAEVHEVDILPEKKRDGAVMLQNDLRVMGSHSLMKALPLDTGIKVGQ